MLNYLREYDDAQKNAEEIPLGIATRAEPLRNSAIAEAKAALFFVAMEDTCGERQMRDGLRS